MDPYERPEFIFVNVVEPLTINGDDGKPLYTTYQINVETNLPSYNASKFFVRRRYNDFSWLRNHLKTELDKKGKRLTIPDLPGNTLMSFFGPGRFDPEFIEERKKGLELFLNSVVKHPWARFEKGLHQFLQDQNFECKDN